MKTKWPAFGFSCLLLAGAAVAISPASAPVAHQLPADTGVTAASISGVEVAQPGQHTTVRISGTGELHFQIPASMLQRSCFQRSLAFRYPLAVAPAPRKASVTTAGTEVTTAIAAPATWAST